MDYGLGSFVDWIVVSFTVIACVDVYDYRVWLTCIVVGSAAMIFSTITIALIGIFSRVWMMSGVSTSLYFRSRGITSIK